MIAAQTVVDALDSVTFGPTRTFHNLAAVPLLVREEREADYLTLDEALAKGWAQITETSESGTVPVIAFPALDGR